MVWAQPIARDTPTTSSVAPSDPSWGQFVPGARRQQLALVAIKPRNTHYDLSFVFSGIPWPNLAPRPGPTGQALKMVQNAS